MDNRTNYLTIQNQIGTSYVNYSATPNQYHSSERHVMESAKEKKMSDKTRSRHSRVHSSKNVSVDTLVHKDTKKK